MRCAPWGPWVLLGGCLSLTGGCGPDLPPPPTLQPNTGGSSTDAAATPTGAEGSARSVYMVLPGPPDQDTELWAIAGQREAGDLRAVFRVIGPGPGVPVLTEAKVIRDAINDGITALVVVPDDSADLPAALAEAEEKRVAVVLLGGDVTMPPGKAMPTRVVPGSFEPSARQVVESLQADARTLGLSATDAAILLIDRGGDRYSKDRVAALKKAAEAAGIKKIDPVEFDGDADKAKVALLEAIKADPTATMVLCDDDTGLMTASRLRMDLNRKPTVLVGGFAGSRGLWDPNYYMGESGFVECRNEKLARLAVWTALSKARGEPTAERVELEPHFNRGRGSSESSWMGGQMPIQTPPPA